MQSAPATKVSAERCPACGQIPSPPGRAHCGMCGTPLGLSGARMDPGPRAGPSESPPEPASASHSGSALGGPSIGTDRPPLSDRAEGLQFLLIGIPIAYLFSVTPMVQFMGWFLASLFHEFGHSVAGWFMGFPSVPAISLSGHAAAVHGEALLIVRVASFAAALGALRWRWTGPKFFWASAALAAVYALLIFTRLGEVLFLTSGHLGELAAGGLCLWRALSDDACHHRAERLAYAMLGWFLIGRNISLGLGLAFSASARATYAGNGSFGLVNDYLRLANDELGVQVSTVGFAMGTVSLLVPIAAIAAFTRSRS